MIIIGDVKPIKVAVNCFERFQVEIRQIFEITFGEFLFIILGGFSKS